MLGDDDDVVYFHNFILYHMKVYNKVLWVDIGVIINLEGFVIRL